MDVRQQRLQLQLAFLRLYTRVRQRPWGLLLYNTENPNYYEANGARYIRTDDADAVIEEIIRFYRTRRLTPRVIVDQATQPTDFRACLQAHGFECAENNFRIMIWDDDCPQPPVLAEGVEIRRAKLPDVEAIVAIEAEDSPWSGTDWLRRRTQTLIAAPSVRYFIAWVDGQPAATAMCFQTEEAGLIESVATRPAFRRRGLASAIIQQIQSDSDLPLLLEVEDNGAERIYARRGFVVAADAPEWQCWLPAD
ncbi:MAG: GNAT family N-acetyltransferase [Caldilineaceae bacterium]|nr:GNAT family N-acetyltransferase [Caldilineaceae bacterium]